MTRAIFTSSFSEWATPDNVFAPLEAEFGFRLDVAALPHNTRCARFLSPDDDALSLHWERYEGPVWCNPPYGRGLGRWTYRGLDAAEHGQTIAMLLPVRTSTEWWHDHVMHAHEVRFVRGRLYFRESDAHAPFSSAVVIWRPRSSPITATMSSMSIGKHVRHAGVSPERRVMQRGMF